MLILRFAQDDNLTRVFPATGYCATFAALGDPIVVAAR